MVESSLLEDVRAEYPALHIVFTADAAKQRLEPGCLTYQIRAPHMSNFKKCLLFATSPCETFKENDTSCQNVTVQPQSHKFWHKIWPAVWGVGHESPKPGSLTCVSSPASDKVKGTGWIQTEKFMQLVSHHHALAQ